MDIIELLSVTDWWVFLIHVLLYPLYQIIGTAKHEYSHAFAAKCQGLTVTEINILPKRIDGRWYWGYFRYIGGKADKMTMLYPYVADIVCILIGFGIVIGVDLFWWFDHRHALLATMIILIVSPVVDIVYNLLKWKIAGRGDFAEAFGSGD
jgi:hypothetical protein